MDSIDLKKIMNTLPGLALCFVILSVHAEVDYSVDIQPDPEHSPADVVSIQMNALKNNDIPFENAGIEIAFRFASPSNKAQTGPIERFKTLFRNSAYTPMLNHKSLQIGPVNLQEHTARIPIIIEDKHNRKIGYIFKLYRQTLAPYENCWMTSSVVPIVLESPEATRQPI